MLVIKTEQCIGCGECEQVCTFGAIRVEDDVAIVDPDTCTLCGTCVDTCPSDALELEKERAATGDDLSAWNGVWVVTESRNGNFAPVSFELLSKARELADKLETRLTAVCMGHEVMPNAPDLISQGADRVLVADHAELASFTEEAYGNTLAELIKKEKPEIVLAGATSRGRSFIPMVATILGTGLTADCTELDVRLEDRALLQTRPAFGGNLLATIVCPDNRPQMATVRPHVFKPACPDATRTGEIIPIVPEDELLKHRVRVIESVREEAEGPKLTEAEIIVTAGRGLERRENIALVNELASLFGGAVGATRAVTDASWVSRRAQIGQTGVTVAPKLYIGCGVSGAIQHLVGMQGSEVIVAVNKDPDAPIFDIATYCVIGDVKEILPLLIRRIKQEQET